MQYVQAKELTEFMDNHGYKDGDLVLKGDKYLMIGESIQKPYDVAILEQKLKKKNEILKKARIKRKNQREELNKLNLKLQKCISLEEHNKKIESIEFDLNMFKSSNKLRGDLIEKLELENTEMCKRIENINKDNVNYLSNNILSRDKEIEKLKAVIEYLESKTK